jgi:hypothetical protein
MTKKLEPSNVEIDANGNAWRPFLLDGVLAFRMNMNLAMDESKQEELKVHLNDCCVSLNEMLEPAILPYDKFMNAIRTRKINESDLI